MSEKHIVICDTDFRYANGLMENIAKRKELAVKTFACTTWEHVEEVAKEYPIHILVVDESFAYEKRSSISAQHVFVLITGNDQNLRDGETGIYKYQCVDQILSEILSVYFDKTKENVMKSVKKRRVEILTVYSPIHRCGKTQFAVAFGKQLAKKKKVLYLNLEGYSGGGGLFGVMELHTLEDLIYYIHQEKGNLGLQLGTIVQKTGELDYVMPMRVCQDLKEVSWDDWKQLLERIMKESMYEVILLDLDECVQGLEQILQMSERIYMPIVDDEISHSKLKQYENNLRKMRQEDILEKMDQFVIPPNMDFLIKRLIEVVE